MSNLPRPTLVIFSSLRFLDPADVFKVANDEQLYPQKRPEPANDANHPDPHEKRSGVPLTMRRDTQGPWVEQGKLIRVYWLALRFPTFCKEVQGNVRDGRRHDHAANELRKQKNQGNMSETRLETTIHTRATRNEALGSFRVVTV